MSAVFYADEAQKKIALQTRERAAAKSKQRLTTAILPLKDFYLAEGYHQKHALRQHPDLLRELTQMYPNEKDLFNSTAAARINAFLGGNGTYSQLEGEIDGFGLSPRGRANLLAVVKRYGK
jgi:hypothetical protein